MNLSVSDQAFHKIYINAARMGHSVTINALASRHLERSKYYIYVLGLPEGRRSAVALAALETGLEGHRHLANTILMFNSLSDADKLHYIMSFKRHAAVMVSGLWSISAQNSYSWGPLPPVSFSPGAD